LTDINIHVYSVNPSVPNKIQVVITGSQPYFIDDQDYTISKCD